MSRPLRFILGDKTLLVTLAAYTERLATWEEWAAQSNSAQGTATIAA